MGHSDKQEAPSSEYPLTHDVQTVDQVQPWQGDWQL
jgi:hypothetical protein